MSHNSCNMGTRGLPDIYTLSPWACALGLWVPDIYTLSPWACGPQASCVYIRQTTLAHITTI